MTEDTVKLITLAVGANLRPDLNAIHGRVNEVAKTVAAIDERTSHMATKDEVGQAIYEHRNNCSNTRKWTTSAMMGIPAIIASILAVFCAIKGVF